MERRRFLTLAVIGAAIPVGHGGLDASRGRLVKRLSGVEELLVYFEDRESVALELTASGASPTGWDRHEADVPLGGRRVEISVDPRVEVERILDQPADAGPGAMWLAFPDGARVTVTETTDPGTLAVAVEAEQET